MDILSAMFQVEDDAGVLSDLASVGLSHRVLLYADDVVIFAELDVREISAV
jgi:hypothetical protein